MVSGSSNYKSWKYTQIRRFYPKITKFAAVQEVKNLKSRKGRWE
jgi:hypothetical protein